MQERELLIHLCSFIATLILIKIALAKDSNKSKLIYDRNVLVIGEHSSNDISCTSDENCDYNCDNQFDEQTSESSFLCS